MILEPTSQNRKVLFAVAIAALILGLAYLAWPKTIGRPSGANPVNGPASPDEPVYCIQDAKLCPDGSYVSRVEPDCRFADCPSDGWAVAVQAVRECRAEKVFQDHDLDVSVDLKDGTTIEAKEPKIDDIVRVAEEAEGKCGRIPIGTE